MQADRSIVAIVRRSLGRSEGCQNPLAVAVGYATSKRARRASRVNLVACSISRPSPLAKCSARTRGALRVRFPAGTRRIVRSGAPGTLVVDPRLDDEQAACAEGDDEPQAAKTPATAT